MNLELTLRLDEGMQAELTLTTLRAYHTYAHDPLAKDGLVILNASHFKLPFAMTAASAAELGRALVYLAEEAAKK